MATCECNAELGREVRVADIDKELHKLWEQDDARTNASLMNLVIYSEKRGSLGRNSELARSITEDHACRVILVELDRAVVEPSIRAWITAHCHLSEGTKSVCCEQIALHLTSRVTGRFRNTLFAHLASDLPLVFWWQGELSDVLSERLANSIDRLIVDSRDWENPADSYRRLGEVSLLNPDLIVQDHAWTRTWQFRMGVASIFDDPAAGDSLPLLDEVEIHYQRRDHNSALQLLAWFAKQAGWKQEGSGLSFRNGKRIVRTSLHATNDGPALSRLILRGVGFEASVYQQPCATMVRREVSAGNYRASSVSPCDPVETEKLLGSQLARGGRNTLFQKILPDFIHLIEKTSCS